MKVKTLATLTALTLILSAPGLCWSQTAGSKTAPNQENNYAPPSDSELKQAGKVQQPTVAFQEKKPAPQQVVKSTSADAAPAAKDDVKSDTKADKVAKKSSKSKSDDDKTAKEKEPNYHAIKAAAMGGDVNAQTILAGLYEHGTGVDQNYALAAKWYLIAAKSGSPTAQASYDTVIKEEQGLIPNPATPANDGGTASPSKIEKQK